MTLLETARELYREGRVHDALEAAQAACDRAPRDPQAWALLARVARHSGMPAASDQAFRRAAELDRRAVVPHRLDPVEFERLIGEVRVELSPDARRRLAAVEVGNRSLPTAEQIAAGVPPDALAHRERLPADRLTLYQVNHENRCATEETLRALVLRSLSRA